MGDLVTTDEVFLNDLEGLLNLDGSFTPRLLTPGPDEGSNGFDALIFTQGLDTSNLSSTGNDSIKATKRTSKREKEKNRQRRYRQRLKDTRDELLRQVQELSRHLSQETVKRTKTDASNELFVRSRWRSEVEMQRQRRLQSEEEKKCLLAAVNSQAEYITELRQVVTKRISAGNLQCQRNAPTLHSMTSVLYMTYLQQLEGCYARVDNVKDLCGLVSMPESTMNSVHKRKSDGSVAYFQHVNKIVVPYSFRQTGRALGRLLYEQDEPAFGGDKMAPDDDVFIRTRVLKGTNTGVLAQRCVFRQYKEEERLVFVWKMSSEGEGGFRGLHAEETG